MKKYFLLLPVAISLQLIALSQNVGIGTNNPQNKLHVAGGFRLDTLAHLNDSGLLRHDKNGVVYSLKFTGSVNDVLRGDGTFGSGGSGGSTPSNVWMLSGNSGTNPSTDFLGTTDAQPLKFRVKNQPSGIIDSTRGNTGLGFKALLVNSVGVFNTAIGFQTLSSNTSTGNTAIGYSALYSNTTGVNNTANGRDALHSNTTGTYNTASGINALYSNTTGNFNTATGTAALYANTTGSANMANGEDALLSNTTGEQNTANGGEALFFNTTGAYNTASGYTALFSNTTASYNTAYGVVALYKNTGGENNTAVGYNALGNTNNSTDNTAIGYNAGGSYNNGWNNVFVGENAGTNGGNYYNVIAIGQGTVCTNVSQVTMGNGATTAYRAYANWTNISDGRYKKDLKEDVPGIAFINKLRPVTYSLDATALDEFLHKDLPKQSRVDGKSNMIMNNALKEKERIRYTGFVAQEVEEAAKELGFNFSGVDAPKNKNDVYGLRYAEFVVPLVKAVQEQQQQIEELKKQNEMLLKRIEKLESSPNTNK